MPVKFKDYNGEDRRLDLSEGTNAHTILSLLGKTPELGYTPKEIADLADIPRGSVSPTLARLEKRGLVKHRGDVWAIGDDDKLAAQGALFVASSASVNDDYAASVDPDWEPPE